MPEHHFGFRVWCTENQIISQHRHDLSAKPIVAPPLVGRMGLDVRAVRSPPRARNRVWLHAGCEPLWHADCLTLSVGLVLVVGCALSVLFPTALWPPPKPQLVTAHYRRLLAAASTTVPSSLPPLCMLAQKRVPFPPLALSSSIEPSTLLFFCSPSMSPRLPMWALWWSPTKSGS